MTANREQPPPGRSAIGEWWHEFWFKPEPCYPLGLIRITFGALMVMWALSLLPHLYDFFGAGGIAPRQPPSDFAWGLFAVWTSDQALLVGWAVLMAAAIMLTVGWHSRLAASVIFVLIVSFEGRFSYVFNAGDGLIRLEALFMAIFVVRCRLVP